MPKLLGVVVVLLALTAGCGDGATGEPAGAREPSTVPTAEVKAGAATVELREVRDVSAVEDAPCAKSEADAPEADAVACDDEGRGYRLAPAAWSGKAQDATAEVPDGMDTWFVSIKLPADGADVLEALSRRLVGTEQQVALVVDGEVIAAPTFTGVIPGGLVQVTGDFTEASAHELADRLTGR